jgi:hypothetical protein
MPGSAISTRPWNEAEEARFREAIVVAQEARRRVESHDPQTNQHAVRVAHWSQMMALRIPSFDRRRLRRLEMSALLHDYGKLWVPSAILNKPGKLDDQEWAQVRQHPVLGAQNAPAGPDEFLEKAAILWHHKGYGGGGYPKGDLAGHHIPIEARITAVVDVFDAVSSARAYRPGGGAMTPDQAFEVLRKASGTLLDPTMVSLFESIYLAEAAVTGSDIGVPTLQVSSVIQRALDRARRLLEREIGPFDPERPLGGMTVPAGLVERVAERLMRVNLDVVSARSVVNHVLRLPQGDTFGPRDLAMSDEEMREAVRRADHHQEATLYLRGDATRPSYLSVVVFAGQLWLCVGEQAGDRVRVSLIG